MYIAKRQQIEWSPLGGVADNAYRYMVLAKLEIENLDIIEEALIPDNGSRPCFFLDSSSLYLIHSISNSRIAW